MHPLLNLRDSRLLQQALTHRSYANENPGEGHNERLEFLGDAVLNFISGEYLYRRYPQMGEDEMTRRRSALVDESQLAKFALRVGLADLMRLGRGAIREGGMQNSNLLSSTFEAVVGAYYLDRGNLEEVRAIVHTLFDSVPQTDPQERSQVNSKNLFQEWVHDHVGHTQPVYLVERIGGSDHIPEFLARVFVEKKLFGEGRGASKKEAEKQAAEDALKRLG
jgi:ribonuclease-3